MPPPALAVGGISSKVVRTVCLSVCLSVCHVSSYLLNAWTCFNEMHHNYFGPRDTDDIFKVIGSKVKVTETFTDRRFAVGFI